MSDPLQHPSATREIWSSVASFVGGGGVVALAEVLRRAYTTRVKREEHGDELRDKRAAREADDSRVFVHEANEERRATLARVDEQAKEITRLSVEVALCREKHSAMEQKDAEKEQQLKQLQNALDLTSQLVERQRREIAAQEEVISSQGRDIVNMHSELATLRTAFDDFVKRTMESAAAAT